MAPVVSIKFDVVLRLCSPQLPTESEEHPIADHILWSSYLRILRERREGCGPRKITTLKLINQGPNKVTGIEYVQVPSTQEVAARTPYHLTDREGVH